MNNQRTLNFTVQADNQDGLKEFHENLRKTIIDNGHMLGDLQFVSCTMKLSRVDTNTRKRPSSDY